MREKSKEAPPVPNENVREPLNGVISFKIPQVVKGTKNTHFKEDRKEEEEGCSEQR